MDNRSSGLNMASDGKDNNYIIVQRIIALWGFNEAAFGGILHALKIPFTGLFIGSIAAVLIILISHYSKNKSDILKATIIVILVKGIVSPYTPVTAYLAVLLEGLLGYLFFTFVKYEFAAALLLGFFSLLFSALQKLIVTTLVFGVEFWKSIDLFADYVFSQIKIFNGRSSLSLSLLLISIYTLLHIVAGILAGYEGLRIPSSLNGKSVQLLKTEFEEANGITDSFQKEGRKKRPWWKKPTRIILLSFLMGMMLLTYFYPQQGKNHAYEIMVMLIRALAIIIIWSLVLSSAIKKILNKMIEKNKFKHAEEINRITNLFPAFRKVINFCWKSSGSYRGLKRIKNFITGSIVLLLICDLQENKQAKS